MQVNRTAAYFEYPSTVAILLREVRYGIELSFEHVTVDPMPSAAFSYHIGNVNVDYRPNGTSMLQVPPSGSDGPSTRFPSSDSSQFLSTCSSLPLVFGCSNVAC